MNNLHNFLVYENWRAENKAVVHKSTCGHANEGHERYTNQWLINNHSQMTGGLGTFGL